MNFVAPLIVLLFLLNGCGRIDNNPIQEYLALAPAQSDVNENQRIRAWVELYNDLENASLPALVEKTYAERLYFNDTLVTLHDRAALLRYLEQTQLNLDGMSFKALSVQEQGDNLWVRWFMRTQFTVLGQRQDVKSIGISHLRFDGDGKVVLHQDYWDSMQGFYLHIPVIGGILQWIKNSLHD